MLIEIVEDIRALCFKIFFIDSSVGVGISFSIAQEVLEFPDKLSAWHNFLHEIFKIMR